MLLPCTNRRICAYGRPSQPSLSAETRAVSLSGLPAYAWETESWARVIQARALGTDQRRLPAERQASAMQHGVEPLANTWSWNRG